MLDRKDIVTNDRFIRTDLIRIAVLKDGTTTIDKEYNKGGRGIYVHPKNLGVALDRNIIKGQVKRFKGNFSQIENILKEENHG